MSWNVLCGAVEASRVPFRDVPVRAFVRVCSVLHASFAGSAENPQQFAKVYSQEMARFVSVLECVMVYVVLRGMRWG